MDCTKMQTRVSTSDPPQLQQLSSHSSLHSRLRVRVIRSVIWVELALPSESKARHSHGLSSQRSVSRRPPSSILSYTRNSQSSVDRIKASVSSYRISDLDADVANGNSAGGTKASARFLSPAAWDWTDEFG